jgi:hypothetical protein
MSAWKKLFADTSRVNSTVSVKRANGKTETAKLVMGAAGLADADFAEAAKHGATLSESRKDTNATGEQVVKKNTIKADDITFREAEAAVRDLLGVPDPVPEATRKRGQAVEPSVNGNGVASK